MASTIDVRPVSPIIGAEVYGVDLSQPLGAEVVSAIRAALVKHLVIFFPGQSITPEQQADFASQFGEPTPAHPVLPAIDAHPNVLSIDSREDRASWWHTDVTYVQTPPLGSILYMLEAPPFGGDTMWLNTQAAYDALSPVVRDLCDRLIAYHHDPFFAADVEAKGGYEWDGTWHEHLYPVSHPLVRTHPESGRNALFVNPQFTVGLEGVSKLESDALLDMVYRHYQRPEFMCRYRWRPGSVAFWDNRGTMHYTLDDYGSGLRLANRVTIRGDVPFGPARPPAKAPAHAGS